MGEPGREPILQLKGAQSMILSKEKLKEFEEVARPLIKFLNDNCHPHVSVIITTTSAELLEGVCSTGQIMDYVHD